MAPKNTKRSTAEKDRTSTPKSISKRILLVSPDSGTLSTERLYFAPPLGVMRLAGYLNSHGHRAEYYDPNLYACTGTGPSLEDKLQEGDWDFIGFSVLDETLVQDIRNIYLANTTNPESLILAGGIEAQFNYQTLLDKTPCRIVVLGEGEVPILMLADDAPWQDIPGIVIKNMAVALSQELFNEATMTIPWEDINYEDYWDVYVKLYEDQWNEDVADQIKTVRIFSRNRCPIGCKYCSSTPQLTLATGGKVPVISTTENNLVDVVDRVVNSHPDVRMIYLTDDDFVINKLSVIEFCKKVIEKDFGDLNFMCFARITDLTEEVISWMSKANFRKLNIGVESFSQKVLDEVGKRCDATKIHSTLALLKKYNVRPFCNIILTTPESTLDDVEITLDNIMEVLEDDFYQAGIIPAIYPLKGTDFAEENCDFKSHIVKVPEAGIHLRRDDYIYAADPLTKEFQIRFVEGMESMVDEFIEDSEIKHANSASLAMAKCRFGKQIIEEIRSGVEEGTFTQTKDVTAGAGRNYSEKQNTGSSQDQSGDSTRHMLV